MDSISPSSCEDQIQRIVQALKADREEQGGNIVQIDEEHGRKVLERGQTEEEHGRKVRERGQTEEERGQTEEERGGNIVQTDISQTGSSPDSSRMESSQMERVGAVGEQRRHVGKEGERRMVGHCTSRLRQLIVHC